MIRNEDIDDGKLYQKLHKVSWCTWLCPAETISPCNFMFHPCRKAVSTKKRRYQKDGYDLDLVYLSDRIIVHGFPAVGLEHIYRNPRYEIKRLLETNHKGKYKVFNFCCEPGRGYSPEVFDGRVERYPFKDHNTPPLETMVAFANSAKLWLDADPENVCSLHCKAGKGRAGLMSCVLLFRSGVCATAKDALDLYDRERVVNNRGLTVTSQRKFVMFYESLWRDYWHVEGSLGDVPGEDPSTETPLYVVPEQPSIPIFEVNVLDAAINVLRDVRIKVFKGTNFKPELKYDSGSSWGRDGSNSVFSCPAGLSVQGNFKIEVYSSKGVLRKMKKVLELWHNTLFMNADRQYIDFDRSQLDLKKAFRKEIGNDIKIRVHLTPRGGPTSYAKGYALVLSDEDGEKGAKSLVSPRRPSRTNVKLGPESPTNDQEDAGKDQKTEAELL